MDNFDKNIFCTHTKPYKVIIDTDPGVDDVACLVYALADEHLDIKLITSVVGNVSLQTATRNLLHLIDILGIDVPVAIGAEKALVRESIDAKFIHQEEGLGGYIPPKAVHHKPLKDDAVEAMYKVIMQNDGDVIPIILGPHTNLAKLFVKHPEVIKKIPKIAFMGGSPYGHPSYPNHISFNISSDPEAFKIVLDSGIPMIMVPSVIGRKHAHLTEEYVNKLDKVNDVGKLLKQMYSMYWEPNFPDKRVATNDSCAYFALVYPCLFTFEKVSVTVNTTDAPGKTLVDFDGVGNVSLVTDVDRENFIKLLDSELLKYNNLDIPTV